jgi:DNA-binding NarL/FixJ family response regulator
VVVIHRELLVRAGLLAAFAEVDGFRVVAADPAGGLGDVGPLPDDIHGEPVIVADYETGLAIVQDARPESPARVLIVTTRGSESEIRYALERGVKGYLLQGSSLAELVDGVRALHEGNRYVSPTAARRLAEALAHPTLTAREGAVLQQLCGGASNKEIGVELDIAIGTVKAHVRSILDKLGASTRTEAAAIARVRGLGRQAQESRPLPGALRNGA